MACPSAHLDHDALLELRTGHRREEEMS